MTTLHEVSGQALSIEVPDHDWLTHCCTCGKMLPLTDCIHGLTYPKRGVYGCPTESCNRRGLVAVSPARDESDEELRTVVTHAGRFAIWSRTGLLALAPTARIHLVGQGLPSWADQA